MSNLIDRQEAVAHLQRIWEASDYTPSYNEGFVDGLDYCITFISTLSSAEAIPVSWIKERIENAINAEQTLIAQMWQELIDGYRRETDERH